MTGIGTLAATGCTAAQSLCRSPRPWSRPRWSGPSSGWPRRTPCCPASATSSPRPESAGRPASARLGGLGGAVRRRGGGNSPAGVSGGPPRTPVQAAWRESAHSFRRTVFPLATTRGPRRAARAQAGRPARLAERHGRRGHRAGDFRRDVLGRALHQRVLGSRMRSRTLMIGDMPPVQVQRPPTGAGPGTRRPRADLLRQVAATQGVRKAFYWPTTAPRRGVPLLGRHRGLRAADQLDLRWPGTRHDNEIARGGRGRAARAGRHRRHRRGGGRRSGRSS